jgi:HEAT repeat protein
MNFPLRSLRFPFQIAAMGIFTWLLFLSLLSPSGYAQTDPVATLIDQMNGTDYVLQKKAIEQLGKSKDPRAPEALWALLRKNKYDVGSHELVIKAIGDTGDPGSVGPLIELLTKEKFDNVRGAAALALGAIKDPRAVDPLIELLSKDKSNNVRAAAATALGATKDPRAVEPLIEVMTKEVPHEASYRGMNFRGFPIEVRMHAIEALGEIKDPRAVEPMLALLAGYKSSLAADAALALGKIGDPRAVEPLIAALKDKQHNATARENAATALGAFHDPRAVEPLIAVLQDKDDPAVRMSVAGALGELKDPRAAGPLITALKDPENRVRIGAAGAILKLGTPALEPLVGALKDPEAVQRQFAAALLGDLKDPRAILPLIASFQDVDPQVRLRAFQATIAIGEPAFDPLLAALKDANASTRQLSVAALAQLGDARAVDPLIAELRDTEEFVRTTSAMGLGVLKDATAVPPLIACLKDPDAQLRQSASTSLAMIGAPAIEPLIAALKDANPQVQQAAAAALGRIGPPALDSLLAALKQEPRVRQLAFDALGQINDPRSMEPLLAALNDSDPLVQQMAREALVRAGIVLVAPKEFSFLQSLGQDLVFFTSADHPILRLAEITSPDSQFAVGEFSQRTLALRQSLAAKSPPIATVAGQPQSFPGVVRPLGNTSAQVGGVTLTGVGEDGFATLFYKNPQLVLFVVPRGMSKLESIEATGGGRQIRFVESQ